MSIGKLSERTKRDAPEFSLPWRRASDAIAGGVSVRIIISGDSDLIMPIQQVRKRFPHKRLIVVFPPNRQSAQLKKAANGFLSIGEDKLRQNQLPDPVITASGFALHPPGHWR